PGDVRAVVRAGAVLAGKLEAELVEQRAAPGADERSGAGVRGVLLDGVRAASPRVDVEGAVFLLRPGVVVTQRGQIAIGDGPVGLGQQHARVIGALDRSVLVRAAELGEDVDHRLFDARRV